MDMMKTFDDMKERLVELDVRKMEENVCSLISKEWMLVCAGDASSFNMMTASWGGLGWLWNRSVAFVFIRPERHTHGFTENHDTMTLSFLGDGCRDILNFCGTKSGRDCDKVAEAGLKPFLSPSGNILFEQARLSLECRKLFKIKLDEAAFIDKSLLDRFYGANGGQHDMYVVEIERVWKIK